MILIIDNVRSAHNVGALFRTADGAGVKEICLIGITPCPTRRTFALTVAEKALAKTALGAERSIPWRAVKTLPPLLRRLRREGYVIAVLEQMPESIDYRDFRPQHRRVALIVGNEVSGIDVARFRDLVDVFLELPMRGAKESLNVSVAAGIALYHLSATMERRHSPRKS